jgi:valine dehydrogenase (NAD+)
MRAAAGHAWGTTSLRGRRVGIEGVGKVGRKLTSHLVEDGAEVVICDVSETATDGVRARHPEVEVAAGTAELLAANLDVFAPCALGGSVDDQVAATLEAKIICGGANNQLAHAGVEKLLADRGILYAPDYVVNAGGVIQVADELAGFSFERARARAEQIFGTTTRIFQIADSDGVPPSAAADRVAEQRMADVGRLRGIWIGSPTA